QLSGGQQSRVALARALLRARPLLLLDEPFAALGPALKAEMLEVLSEIAGEQGTTVLMVSHDPADALAFAPLSVLVADGRAHPPQPTAPLLANPPPALAAYLG
ncbi:ATP-binding cassette domain-containing protein, partial [Candidatus Falkowbacteria bacterium]|nr:ATP-binding cassette domain-containing protein [Candidatus Falkowbacteria bacterium]